MKMYVKGKVQSHIAPPYEFFLNIYFSEGITGHFDIYHPHTKDGGR